MSGAGPVSRAYVPGACQDDAKDVVFKQLSLLAEDVFSSKIAEKHLKLPGYPSVTEYLSKPSFKNSIPKTKIP